MDPSLELHWRVGRLLANSEACGLETPEEGKAGDGEGGTGIMGRF
jgi:hypothetical protein